MWSYILNMYAGDNCSVFGVFFFRKFETRRERERERNKESVREREIETLAS